MPVSGARGRPSVRIAADIGGTFTDLVLTTETGEVLTAKVSTTPRSPETAVIEGTIRLLGQAGESGRMSPRSCTARPSARMRSWSAQG
jgi:N-methylhydantoinase A/oxoprolinase/acetone carboxylase beta subunit